MTRSSSLTADLVLEGGGVLGIGHVGAISVLEDAGYSFARVAGTSAGLIVGALVAAGMPASRITQIMTTVDYRRFADRSLLDWVPVAGPLLSLLLDDGVFEGDHLREWLGNLLVDECGVETFADLAIDDAGSSLPPERRYRLVVTATDVTRGELVYFPWDYQGTYGLEPDRQLVVDAVRASTSIPFFFEPATLVASDGTPSTLVDGGVLSNFPTVALEYQLQRQPDDVLSLTLSNTFASTAALARGSDQRLAQLSQHHSHVLRAGPALDPEAFGVALQEFMARFILPAEPPEPLVRSQQHSGAEVYQRMHGSSWFEPNGQWAAWDSTDRLSRINVATLVIGGTNDQCVPDLARDLAAGIPDAELEVLDAAHLPFFEIPEECFTVLRRFLAQVETRR